MLKTTSVLALVVLLCACGGGGGGGGMGPIVFQVAPNVPAMSGYIRGPTGAPIVYPSSTYVLWAGDAPNNTAEKAYYRFDLSSLPAGATIVEAVFHVGQGAAIGAPFARLGGQVLIDHMNLGASLDPLDYSNPNVYTTNAGMLSTGPTPLGSRSANITHAVQADVSAGRFRTDICLRFGSLTNGDNAYDTVSYNNMNDDLNLGVVPRLEIRYRAP